MSDNRHPEAGQVRRLYSYSKELHGLDALVIDWLDEMRTIHPGCEELVQALIARSSSAEHPLNLQSQGLTDRRYVLVRLVRSEEFLLVHTDELFVLENLQRTSFNTLACVKGQLEGLEVQARRLTVMGLFQHNGDRQVVLELKSRIEAIRKLVESDGLLTTSAGIATLRVATERARSVYSLIESFIGDLTARRREERRRHLLEFGSMTSCDYGDHFRPRDVEHFGSTLGATTCQEITALVMLRHDPSLDYNRSLFPSVLQLVQLMDELELSAEAQFGAFCEFMKN